MTLQVREPKSSNITLNPLRVILNNLHYEQRCIKQTKQYHSTPRHRSPRCSSQVLSI